MLNTYPNVRMRRLRSSELVRDIFRETSLSVNDLMYPIFVEENIEDYLPVKSMPGIFRIPEARLENAIEDIAKLNIKAVMMFGISHSKDEIGSSSWHPQGLLSRMIAKTKQVAPNLVVAADVCFCEYTDHGHCGVLSNNCVDNDATLKNLEKQAVIAARAGADIIAPSGMMDGQVATIRAALDGESFHDIPIMSYSTKFHSAMYGPFREAAGCELKGSRSTYQMDPANSREAIRESLLDECEGADVLMVKPALSYLDVIANIRSQSLLPLAAYQVSGEYSMIKFAALAGALNEDQVVREQLVSIKRAGADLIITYFAKTLAEQGI